MRTVYSYNNVDAGFARFTILTSNFLKHLNLLLSEQSFGSFYELIPSLCDLKQPEAHSDFTVPSAEITKYVLVVTSRITPPTTEEFLLQLFKPCKNAERSSFPERMEAVKNSKKFSCQLNMPKSVFMQKIILDFCMSPHPLKMTLGKKCDLFHANMQYWCIVIIVSNGKILCVF